MTFIGDCGMLHFEVGNSEAHDFKTAALSGLRSFGRTVLSGPSRKRRVLKVRRSMKEIPLTQGMVALIDDEDFERVITINWHASLSKDHNTYYAMGYLTGRKHIAMHRIILGANNPQILIDHIDGNGLHNWRSNLRMTNNSVNILNSPKRCNTTSKFKGVTWKKSRNKWCAWYSSNHTTKHIGLFDDELSAARARDAKIIEMLGIEQATIGRALNFPLEVKS